MEGFKDKLHLLILLQERDEVLNGLRRKAGEVPVRIAERNSALQELKGSYEETKKELTQLQVAKKQKELDLEAQESAIKKHSTELNSLKTNDTYKAMLTEIENAKKAKSSLENDILDVMEKIEAESKLIKEKEKSLKDQEGGILKEISALEAELAKINAEISGIEAERDNFAKSVPGEVLSKYDHIREHKEGVAVVSLDGENCGGCHITLRPQIINDVCKEQDFVYCDSCSRIIYKK